MTREQSVVQGIFSSYEYKRRMYRTGRAGFLKRKHNAVEKVYHALQTIDRVRPLNTTSFIGSLRSVRRVVYKTLHLSHQPALSGLDRDITVEVAQALNHRIAELAGQLPHRNTGPTRDEYKNTISKRVESNIQSDKTHREFLSYHDPKAYGAGDTANGGFREIQDTYRLERALSSHMSSNVYRKWLNSNTHLNFNNWNETVFKWMIEDGAAGQLSNAGDSRGVKYLDEKERKAYAITITNSIVYDHLQDLVDTGQYTSQGGMGNGWGIFVIDFHGDIYIGNHDSNLFHHSSFLSGAPVASAGEIAIHSGKVVGITNKTGHYRSGPNELAEAMRVLEKGGIDLNTFLVCDCAKSRVTSIWHTGSEVKNAGGSFKKIRTAPRRAPPQVPA